MPATFSTRCPLQFSAKVRHRKQEAQDIVVLDLEAEDPTSLPPMRPGDHIDVRTPIGQVRQYSLCGPSNGAGYQIAILKEMDGRGGSTSMHERVLEGQTLEISEPKNHFPLVEDSAFSLLFAGGIGITPIIAMADRLHALGKPFRLEYSAKSEARAAFVERLRAAPYAASVRFHFSEGTPASRLDIGTAVGSPIEAAHIYVCGPQSFLNAVRAAAADRGWADGQIHFEYFAGVSSHSPSDRHFELVLARSGRTIRVEAEQSVTDALVAAGVAIETSCEQGVCGTCLTKVLEGEVQHNDLFLTPEEQAANDQFLPCCSRSKSARLVIDL